MGPPAGPQEPSSNDSGSSPVQPIPAPEGHVQEDGDHSASDWSPLQQLGLICRKYVIKTVPELSLLLTAAMQNKFPQKEAQEKAETLLASKTFERVRCKDILDRKAVLWVRSLFLKVAVEATANWKALPDYADLHDERVKMILKAYLHFWETDEHHRNRELNVIFHQKSSVQKWYMGGYDVSDLPKDETGIPIKPKEEEEKNIMNATVTIGTAWVTEDPDKWPIFRDESQVWYLMISFFGERKTVITAVQHGCRTELGPYLYHAAKELNQVYSADNHEILAVTRKEKPLLEGGMYGPINSCTMVCLLKVQGGRIMVMPRKGVICPEERKEPEGLEPAILPRMSKLAAFRNGSLRWDIIFKQDQHFVPTDEISLIANDAAQGPDSSYVKITGDLGTFYEPAHRIHCGEDIERFLLQNITIAWTAVILLSHQGKPMRKSTRTPTLFQEWLENDDLDKTIIFPCKWVKTAAGQVTVIRGVVEVAYHVTGKDFLARFLNLGDARETWQQRNAIACSSRMCMPTQEVSNLGDNCSYCMKVEGKDPVAEEKKNPYYVALKEKCFEPGSTGAPKPVTYTENKVDENTTRSQINWDGTLTTVTACIGMGIKTCLLGENRELHWTVLVSTGRSGADAMYFVKTDTNLVLRELLHHAALDFGIITKGENQGLIQADLIIDKAGQGQEKKPATQWRQWTLQGKVPLQTHMRIGTLVRCLPALTDTAQLLPTSQGIGPILISVGETTTG